MPLILAFPISVVFSIFCHRLWEIDIVVNRALVYGLLTGILLLLYFGSVVMFQSLIRLLTGEGSHLSVVASTLIIAALFNPIRRRIQDMIARHLYRRKYHAVQVLAQFSVSVRDEVDLDCFTGSLLSLLDDTIQSEHISLWLAESKH